jgi:diaminopimelate decarboxylase
MSGAYGMMSSNYNSRPFIAEVMVNGERHSLIRKRGSYEDLIRNEKIPGYLR